MDKDERNDVGPRHHRGRIRWASFHCVESIVRLFASFSLLLVSSVVVMAAEAPPVPFPEGFRDWHHVKTTVILPGHAMYPAVGGINHVYANAQAMLGFRHDRFPDGAVLVFDTIEEHDADHAISEGRRKLLGVMVKDAERYTATGGWGFENFDAGDPKRPVIGSNAATACFACHSAAGTHDHVYSHPRN